MQRFVINSLALVGGLVVAGWLAAFAIRYVNGSNATGIVMGPNNKPAAGIPVFLDRGRNAIEHYVTDSRGRFSLPVSGEDLRYAKWLICVPGGIPMVGERNEAQIGPTTYGFAALAKGKGALMRTYGWRGPVPRECPPASDTIGWRRFGSDTTPYSFSISEPDWSEYSPRR